MGKDPSSKQPAFLHGLVLSGGVLGAVGIAMLKPTRVKWVMQDCSLQVCIIVFALILAHFWCTWGSLWAGSWSAQLTIKLCTCCGSCRMSWLRLDPAQNNTTGFRAGACLSAIVQERNILGFVLFCFVFPTLPSHLGYFWTCAFFVTWKLKTDELLQYAYFWKLQLLRSECQPACWWAHLLYFICFVIQIFLRPFLSIYSQSSCAIGVWVQMASVLVITFLTVTWTLWDKSWLLPFVSHANRIILFC